MTTITQTYVNLFNVLDETMKVFCNWIPTEVPVCVACEVYLWIPPPRHTPPSATSNRLNTKQYLDPDQNNTLPNVLVHSHDLHVGVTYPVKRDYLCDAS